jgi:hypothetical protein
MRVPRRHPAIGKDLFVDSKEYKVITSNTPIFGNPAKLKQTLAEEAQAGWDLEEIIDNTKIRVGRDKSHRTGDASRMIDPYRINVGMNPVLYFSAAAGITIAVIWLIIQAAAMSVV